MNRIYRHTVSFLASLFLLLSVCPIARAQDQRRLYGVDDQEIAADFSQDGIIKYIEAICKYKRMKSIYDPIESKWIFAQRSAITKEMDDAAAEIEKLVIEKKKQLDEAASVAEMKKKAVKGAVLSQNTRCFVIAKRTVSGTVDDLLKTTESYEFVRVKLTSGQYKGQTTWVSSSNVHDMTPRVDEECFATFATIGCFTLDDSRALVSADSIGDKRTIKRYLSKGRLVGIPEGVKGSIVEKSRDGYGKFHCIDHNGDTYEIWVNPTSLSLQPIRKEKRQFRIVEFKNLPDSFIFYKPI